MQGGKHITAFRLFLYGHTSMGMLGIPCLVLCLKAKL